MRTFFLGCFLFSQIFAYSQEKTISFSLNESPVIELLNTLETAFEVRFSYSDEILSDQKINFTAKNNTLSEIISRLNANSNLYFEIVSKRNIIILKSNPNKETYQFENQVLEEIVLKNYLTRGIQKRKDGSFRISPKELEILPGITEPDVFQSVQLLPGVISPEETSTGIHVRGGSPDQNLILWDDIKIYHSGHLFGTFSAFNPYITEDVQFINKGTDAKYGDRVSSVIDIKTSNAIASNFHGGIGLNMIEADAFFEAPIIKDKLSVLMSVRRSFTDVIASKTYVKLSDKVFQNSLSNTNLTGDTNFFYFDYNLKINWKIAANNFMNLSYINIENELDNNLSNTENIPLFKDKLETENSGLSYHWNKKWSDKLAHQLHIYQSKYDLTFFEPYAFGEQANNALQKSNNVLDTGLNLDFSYRIIPGQSISGGYQFSNNHIKYSFSNSNDISSNQILNSHALYGTYHYKNEKLFDINAGVRFNYYDLIEQIEFEPRINFFKRLNPNLNLNLTAERKTQAVSQINEIVSSNLTLENEFWTISNNDAFPLVKSLQFTGGFSYTKNNWNFEIDAYFKEISGLTSLNIGFIDITDSNVKEGESLIKGVDFYLKKQFGNYKTWASYTLSSVKNHFEGINEDKSFSANTDITNNLYWSNEYSYKKFQFALGWRWHTGKPYSKATEFIVNDEGYKILSYEAINSYRLPNYHRMDFSSTYKFDLLKKQNMEGKLGISVLNIFNVENILNRSYTINPINNQINSIDTRSLERVTNIVFRISW